ncbi:phosphatidylserine decarboxylase related protein [Methanococcus aeolicus Nankai-3]|uniref:Putative archaetidylserine decarboxylase proenzyme n=1 Tax=Methanococcus aeolicus (strain ATCC BAA-1280 / DSM 17508 / OCM 812 / Nankai-3) TaxID=419665 RepID=A6UTW3_META3|nr:phosphatidylserine decarboxylase [Methanococcus aeolicus]ABR55935.1 phosphatidylserine decarboxylase related protein [Methanococcus aeolicus Nankai-3]
MKKHLNKHGKKYQAFFAIGICSMLLFTGYFYRDPDRTMPIQDNICISPADGKVMYIYEYNGSPILFKDGNKYVLNNISKYYPNGCVVVGIFMSPFDVHYNRAPMNGTVILNHHVDGGFYPAYDEINSKKNERNIIIIKNKYGENIGVVQIAGIAARRVVSYVNEGDTVEIGQKIGQIKLGSQTAIILPKDKYNITVKMDEQTYAGETIIAKRIAN